MNNNINRGNTECKPRDHFDLEVEGGDSRKLSLCQEVFWGAGEWGNRPEAHIRMATQDYCLVQLIIIIIIILAL